MNRVAKTRNRIQDDAKRRDPSTYPSIHPMDSFGIMGATIVLNAMCLLFSSPIYCTLGDLLNPRSTSDVTAQ